jgi:Putative peptidoglycan binding domain
MGYLQGVTMTSTRYSRWTCALVVTAAAAFILATPSSAQAQATPLPSAGWHGAPIKRPLPARDPVATIRARGDRSMSLGAGFGRTAGSPDVRALQRILRSLGYACGPADGLFGTRTQASLQWFQIKHGLRPTGSADAETLRVLHLRDRARAPQEARPRADAPASSQAPSRAPATAPRLHPAATPSHVAPAPQHDGQGLGAVPIALLLAAAVAVLSLLLTVGWRRSWRTHTLDATARLAHRLRSAPALLRRTKAAPVPPRAPGQS